MMNDEIVDVLKEVTVSVLETAAFLFIDEEELELTDCVDQKMTGGEINFSGHKNGRVNLWMSSEALDATAKNMLGLDDESEVSIKQQNDALLEILNMISGNVLTSIFGDKVVFKLSIPQIILHNQLSESIPQTFAVISAEAGPIVIAFDLNN